MGPVFFAEMCLPQALVYPVVAVWAADNSFPTALLARVAVRLISGDCVTRTRIDSHNCPSLGNDDPVFAFAIGALLSSATITRHAPAIFHRLRFVVIFLFAFPFYFWFWGYAKVRNPTLDPDKHSRATHQAVDVDPFLDLGIWG